MGTQEQWQLVLQHQDSSHHCKEASVSHHREARSSGCVHAGVCTGHHEMVRIMRALDNERTLVEYESSEFNTSCVVTDVLSALV